MLIPHIWYESRAIQAAEWYCSLIPNSRIISKAIIPGPSADDIEQVSFELWGQRFEAMGGGGKAMLNPSISFILHFDSNFFQNTKDPAKAARKKFDELWNEFVKEGKVMVELGEYDFSPHYGWVEDIFGVSWQFLIGGSEPAPKAPITPAMLFVGEQCGRAEEARDVYRTLFPASQEGGLIKYPETEEYERPGNIKFSDFTLSSTWISVMESGLNHQFAFNESLSFIVLCKDQKEIDHFWNRLSAVPEAEQSGWLKDRFGVSWQIIPERLKELLTAKDEKKRNAVINALLTMKKCDIDVLQNAYTNAADD